MPNYVTVFVVAGVVVLKDGKILMVQEVKPEVAGKWNFPAGRVEDDDGVEETAIKEAREESGYDVKIIKKVGIFQGDIKDACKHIFLADIVGDQHAEKEFKCSWFTPTEIKDMRENLRGDWILEVVAALGM